MLTDLKQPARRWLAEHIKNFGVLLEADEDPSCRIEYKGMEIEIRLNKLPGHFERREVELC